MLKLGTLTVKGNENMKFFNGTDYSESAKGAENDFLHILACDNGTFTVSHKESGRVFFEMPTLLIGKHDTYSYCTHATVQKCRRGQTAVFETQLAVAPPIINVGALALISEPVIFYNAAVLTDTVDVLSFNASLNLPNGFTDNDGYEAVLRFPFGIDEPTVDGMPYEDVLPHSLAPTECIKLTDENGDGVTLTNASDIPVSIEITRDGCLDVYLPTDATSNEFGLIDFEFELSF